VGRLDDRGSIPSSGGNVSVCYRCGPTGTGLKRAGTGRPLSSVELDLYFCMVWCLIKHSNSFFNFSLDLM
jgi:hypothetical protein